MNGKERVLAALRLEKPDRVPYMELAVDGSLVQKILGNLPATAKNIVEALKLDGYGANVYPQLAARFGSAGNGEMHYVGGKIRGSQDMDLAVPGDVWKDAGNFDHVKRLVEEIGKTHGCLRPPILGWIRCC